MDERLPKEVHVSLNEDGTLSTSFPPFPDWFDGVMGLVVGQRYVPEALLAEAVREARAEGEALAINLFNQIENMGSVCDFACLQCVDSQGYSTSSVIENFACAYHRVKEKKEARKKAKAASTEGGKGGE